MRSVQAPSFLDARLPLLSRLAGRMGVYSLGQHREWGSILLGSIGSTREIELW